MTSLEDKALQTLAQLLGSSEQQVYGEYRERAATFTRDVLRMSMWEEQEALIERVQENRFTVVEAGHGVGKSIGAAMLVCWWLCVNEEAKVITLAPTWAQVANVLWRYIRSMARKARLPGNVFETPRWDITPDRFAIGLSPRKATAEDVATLQGYHSPRLLVILDEAPGINRILWEAIRSLAVGDGNRILAIGNPIEQSGPFWEACLSETWEHQRISCLDHPNVVQKREVIPGAVSHTWVKEMIRDHCVVASEQQHSAASGFGHANMLGRVLPADAAATSVTIAGEEEEAKITSEGEAMTTSEATGMLEEAKSTGAGTISTRLEEADLIEYSALVASSSPPFLFDGVWYRPNSVFQSRVLGQAPQEAPSQLISLAWVIQAQKIEYDPIPPTVIGFDPARYGGDAATMCARAGPRVLWLKRRYPRSENPGVELAGWIKEEASLVSASVIYVDEIGIGSTVVDQCRVLGLNVRGTNGMNRPQEADRFFNFRTEIYWNLREALRKGELSLPADTLLEGDLVALNYTYDEKGRYQLERKELVQKRLGRSPDSGDALSLTFAYAAVSTLPEGANPVHELKSDKPSRWMFSRPSGGSRWKRPS